MNNAEAIDIIKRHVPTLRRRGSVAIVHSGGKQTRYRCLCGAEHTVATRNRGTTRHEARFFADHEDCPVRIVAAGKVNVIKINNTFHHIELPK